MTAWFAALWLMLHPSPDEVERFWQTDPADLTVESAREHLIAARAAAMASGVDPAELLAIAWHESRYRAHTITREPGRRVSCGPMTPTPQRRCSSEELSTIGGYVAGAEHYGMWLAHCRGSVWCALTSYAGGSGLVAACRRHGHWRGASGRDACRFARDVSGRAAMIGRALYSSKPSPSTDSSEKSLSSAEMASSSGTMSSP